MQGIFLIFNLGSDNFSWLVEDEEQTICQPNIFSYFHFFNDEWKLFRKIMLKLIL